MRMRTRRYPSILLAAAVLVLFSFSSPANAMVFNPHYIMSDAEMREFDSMSFLDIIAFLEERGGLNAHYDVDAIDGLLKGTAQLIDDAAKRYRINPKYILALLQKESGIVETQTPTQRQLDWAAGYALCDGCHRSNPLAQKYMGFGKQIDAGAGWMDWYLTNAETLTYLKQPGVTYTISSTQVTPANLTTAALYNYTPHIQGNRLLMGIWERWFGDGTTLQYPEGSLLRNADSGEVILIQNGKSRPILNLSVLTSRFDERNVIDISSYTYTLLAETDPGKPVKFPNGALVRTETDDLYLLVGLTKRPILSEETFSRIGFNPEEVEDVLSEDIEDYTLGTPVTVDEAFPTGQLVQDTTTGGVFWAEAGVKHPIWDRAILDANFPNKGIVPMSPEELDVLAVGTPITFRDGTLLKAPDSPSVFVVANGLLRSIPSETVFLAFGYQWTNIYTTSAKALSLHAIGEPLLLLEGGQIATEI